MRYLNKIVALSTAFFVTACSDVKPLEIEPLPKVKIVQTTNDTNSDNFFLPAVASAADKSELSFRVSGEVRTLMVRDGSMVKKGDVIAELDPTDYQLDVDNAQARYKVLDSQYKRSSTLVEKGLLATSQFDEIVAERKIAFTNLELAKLRLSFTTLLSPFDGTISRVNVEQFENIQIGQHIVNIHNSEQVEVLLQLPDSIFVKQANIEDLMDVEAIVRSPRGNYYLANVKEFTTEPDPATGTFTVTLIMPMPTDELVLDGMALEITPRKQTLNVALSRGVHLPIEAVFNSDNVSDNAMNEHDDVQRSSFVWVVNEDNTVTKRRVVLGDANQNSLHVVSGINVGETVVIAGIMRLREGMTIDILPQETSTNE